MSGTRVVLTGAAGAFGRAITERLERSGARVVGIDREPRGIAGVIPCDITDAKEVRRVVAQAAAELGGIDVLINNAGIGTASLVEDGQGDEERAVLDVNLGGSWNVTAAVLPELIRSRGQVVNVASLLAVVAMPYTSAYAASKRGLCALSDVLRMEHRGRLAVSTVYPGYSATPIHAPAEARSGKSLKGLVPEETPGHVARAVERAVRRRRRDVTTTVTGWFVLRCARAFPGVVDAVLVRRLARRGLLPGASVVPAPSRSDNEFLSPEDA